MTGTGAGTEAWSGTRNSTKTGRDTTAQPRSQTAIAIVTSHMEGCIAEVVGREGQQEKVARRCLQVKGCRGKVCIMTRSEVQVVVVAVASPLASPTCPKQVQDKAKQAQGAHKEQQRTRDTQGMTKPKDA